MRILFVEDHQKFTEVAIQHFLSAHEVTVAHHLSAARRLLAQGSFEAILLDYDLPDGLGVDLMRDLKLVSPRPVVVAIAAHQAGNEALMEVGADAVCSKMRFSGIEGLLRELLR